MQKHNFFHPKQSFLTLSGLVSQMERELIPGKLIIIGPKYHYLDTSGSWQLLDTD